MKTVPAEETYEVQVEHNAVVAQELLDAIFPGVEPEIVKGTMEIVSYLYETKVNPEILPKVIRGVHNIIIGLGKGQVIVHVNGNTTNVQIKETDETVETRL